MNRIFYQQVNTLGVRRPTMKANFFKGKANRRMPNEATALKDCSWAVIHDPEGTISSCARFGKMDLDHGVNEGAWVHGTVFENTVTHKLYVFDKKAGKILPLKDKVNALEDRVMTNAS